MLWPRSGLLPRSLRNRNSKHLIASSNDAWTMADDKIEPAEINASAVRMDEDHGAAADRLDRKEAATTVSHDPPGKASDGKISLGIRAPTDSIPERTWIAYLAAPYGLSLQYLNVLSQKTQCIRSQEGRKALTYELNIGDQKGGIIGVNAGVSTTHETVSFPYPGSFRRVMAGRATRTVSSEARLGIVGSEMKYRTEVPEAKKLARVGTKHVKRTKTWILGFETRWIALKRTSETGWEGPVRPIYVVVGIFQRGHTSPRERVVFVHKPEHLFRKLGWATFRLRGLTGTFLSLKHVKGFGLYKCDPEKGTHERLELDRDGLADLQLLADVYKQWYVSASNNCAWADWIHRVLNGSSQDVQQGVYSLELVLDWSVARISIVIILPVLLSLGVGFWLNSKDWTDLATIQTAWGTASYIVTTASLIAALLAIMSSLGGH